MAKDFYSRKTITSKDGTEIGFRQIGKGPGVVILHGGALASQHYRKLGAALSEKFTVYLPDRRGRGMSGPYGPHYGIAREDEDLAAMITVTGAPYVFGVADGGLFALHGAKSIPQIRKVAVFEPVLFVGQPGLDAFKTTVERGQRLVDDGDLSAAMASLARDSYSADPRTMAVAAPYRALGRIMTRPAFCRTLLWADARRTKAGDATLRELIVAWKDELNIVKATEGSIDEYRAVGAEVLLMSGAGAPPLFTGTLDALQEVLPRASRVEMPGLTHGGAQDQGGNPVLVAAHLRRFFDG